MYNPKPTRHLSGALRLSAACLCLTLLLIAGCSGSGGESVIAEDASESSPNNPGNALARGELPSGTNVTHASCDGQINLEGGRVYRVQIPSRVDGAAIVFQMFEPDQFDCAGRHPLILQGHGYSGSRTTDKGGGGDPTGALFNIGAPIAELTTAGFTVISIDQRGHGESGGTVRVMDPDFEGQDLIAIVDWAEQHLDYLAYENDNLLLGATGGSYGGIFQYLLYGVDPDQRLDAIVPEIAPHDLDYSLNPGNVVKSYWALALAGLGDANTELGQDPFIRATLLEGGVTGLFPEAARPFFNYHSLSYFCDNPMGIAVDDDGDTSEYLLDPVTSLLPITADGRYIVQTPMLSTLPPVDALIVQGVRDDLFNFNEAYNNYQCLQRGGGDVRLLTYSFGHHFLSPNLGLLVEAINAQNVPFETKCGPIDIADAAVTWFQDKLQGIGDADAVITTGQDICYALSPGDAVSTPEVTVGGEAFPIELPGGLPAPVVIGNPAPVVVPLTTAGAGGEVIAGIPTATLDISRGDSSLDALCQPVMDPLLRLGACDTTIFVGLGVIKLGSVLPVVPELIEEQVIPVRGIGRFEIELAGVAERIAEGDQIVLLLYGLQDAFVASTSRDVLTPLVTVTGSVRVPLLGPLPNLTAGG